MSTQHTISDKQKQNILAMCEAADYAQFSELPPFIGVPLLELLDDLGKAVGYIPVATDLMDEGPL